MPIICPTILASTPDDYKDQIEKISHFGKRIQIDLTDGEFAKSQTVGPGQIWWPAGFAADIHLMYKDPSSVLKEILSHQPNLIIIHAEADGDFNKTYEACRDNGVRLGVALLPSTQADVIADELSKIDHVLIFSGDLGNFGGHADLSLLEKAAYLKEKKPELEIGWDGGINDRNISELVFGGVDVLNVGGYIQNADNPEKAYSTLFRIAEETGTT
jgi:ribulose-phosphate 3-epimerase